MLLLNVASSGGNFSGGVTYGPDAGHTHNFSGSTGGISANHSHLNSTHTFAGPSGATGISGAEHIGMYININYIIKLQ